MKNILKIWWFGTLLLVGWLGSSCTRNADSPPLRPEPCSPAWYQAVEARALPGDGRGHGPDLGSAEWQSVVEFKLGVRGARGGSGPGQHGVVPLHRAFARGGCRKRQRIKRFSLRIFAPSPAGTAGEETCFALPPGRSDVPLQHLRSPAFDIVRSHPVRRHRLFRMPAQHRILQVR